MLLPPGLIRCSLRLPRASKLVALAARLALAVSLLLGGSLHAQSPASDPPREAPATVDIGEIDQATRAHLERAQQFLLASQWAEAVDTLRQVMDADSDRLIAMADDSDAPITRYVRIREYCHGLLCRWSVTAPEALAEYRREVDPIAERWLADARERRDPALVARIVEQFFASSVGDEALLLLGEYALERGDYTLARRAWETLHPALRLPQVANADDLAPGRPLWLALRPTSNKAESTRSVAELLANASPATNWLVYPDSEIPAADVLARLVLVSILEGSRERAQREWQWLAQVHPDARGRLAGREGVYRELLEELLQQSAEWPRRPPSESITWGGSERRNPDRRDTQDVGGAPLWRVPLTPVSARQDVVGNALRVAEDADAALSYFPLIVGPHVFVADRSAVYAFDLQTGRPAFGSDPSGATSPAPASRADAVIYEVTPRAPAVPPTEALQFGVPRYTLSASDGRLFARLGSPVTRWPGPLDVSSANRGQVVGLELAAEGKLLPGFPLELEGNEWTFDGTPLVHGTRLYAALRRQDEVHVEAHIACFDALTGRRLWRRFVCAAETAGQGRVREITHNLLTLAGSTLYFNTNLGVIAALDMEGGRTRWLARYPRAAFAMDDSEAPSVHYFRDLAPAVVDRDVVYVAPADSDRLFALDAGRGQLLWATPPGLAADARYLLGTSGDYLLASGESLYWFDRWDGRPVTQFPAPRAFRPGHAWPEPRGYGRGVLGPNEIYWPTRTAIYVFRITPQAGEGGWTPVLARAPMELAAYGIPSGNLVAGANVLLIASATELVALRSW